jgi:alpha-beta hydrolase superfamily lysophospholipase
LSPIVIGLAVAALATLLFGLDRVANRVVDPAPRPFERTVPELGLEHEDLRITSGDHELAAWLLKPSEAQPHEPLLLVAHGWSANYSTVLRLAEPLAEAGHDLLLFDVRGHGRSEPVPYVTIRHFRDDLMAVARYAARRFPDRQLVLIGHSLGGAAGVLASADGAPIDGLVLIASPSDVMRVTAEFLTDKGFPGPLLVTVLRPFFWRRVGGSFRPLTPSRRIRELDLPLLIIQPENDARVYRTHAEQLSAASGQPYELIEGYEHTDVLEAPETLRLIEDFLERV